MKGVLARKAFHVAAGMIAPLGALVVSRPVLLWGLGIAAALAILSEAARFTFPRLNALMVLASRPLMRRQETSRIAGSTYLVLATFLTFLLFPRDLAITAVSFLAIGDAVGAVVGVAFAGGVRPEKNWQGRLACFVSCLLVGILLGHLWLNVDIFIVLGGAATAAVVETVTLPIDDNLTIPVLSASVMAILARLL